ncbi:Nitrilase [Ceratobasidium sp. 414]|nr:Nitrilase [Ceratobasidium sp. 414]
MPQKLKVSVVQTCTAAYSLPDTLDKLDRLVRLAKERDGSQFCVFPEAFVGGYPRFSSFGAVVGSRTPAGRDEFLRYHSAAITLSPGSLARARIESVARIYGVFLVVGVIEKDDYAASAGTLYCTAIFIDPERGMVGKHRKLMPTAAERIVWGMGDGSTIPVLECAFAANEGSNETHGEDRSHVKAMVAATICWCVCRSYFTIHFYKAMICTGRIICRFVSLITKYLMVDRPTYSWLVRTHYYSKGVQLYCAPTVDSRPAAASSSQPASMRNRKISQRVMQYRRALSPIQRRQVTLPAPSVMIGGGSVIVGPLGEVLAGPLKSGEDVLTAEIDLDDCLRGKLDLDVVGHYARNDSEC